MSKSQAQAKLASPSDEPVTAAPSAPLAEQAPNPAKPKAPELHTSGKVKFVTRRPGLQIMLGNKRVVFDGREALVDEATAEKLKAHFLFAQGHILLAEDTRIVGGEIVEVSASAKKMLTERKPGEFVFMFSEVPNLVLTLIPGKLVVPFSAGYAKVDAETAEVMRRHSFFVQGRMTEVVE